MSYSLERESTNSHMFGKFLDIFQRDFPPNIIIAAKKVKINTNIQLYYRREFLGDENAHRVKTPRSSKTMQVCPLWTKFEIILTKWTPILSASLTCKHQEIRWEEEEEEGGRKKQDTVFSFSSVWGLLGF